MFRKKNKRIISVILIVLITLLMMPTFSMAEKEEKEKWEGDTLNYVSLGDSIATGDAIIPTKAFPEQLKKYINGRATNLARSGATTGELLESLKMNGDNPFRVSDINAIKKADVITISIGANNLLQPILQGQITDYDGLITAIYKFKGEFSEIMDQLKKMNGNAQIYVLNLYNPFVYPAPSEYGSLDPTYKQYTLINIGILKVNYLITLITSSINNEIVVDVFGAYDAIEQQTYMYPLNPLERDIHPNQTGQNIIFDLIIGLLIE